MTKYRYSLVRFVPNTSSGEFVNIGAIVGSDEASDWDYRQVTNLKRANAIGSSDALGKVMDRVTTELQAKVYTAQEAAEAGSEVSINESWLRQLWLDHHRILQFSEPRTILAASARVALDMIFETVVKDPAFSERASPRTRAQAASVLADAYRRAGLFGARTVRRRSLVRGASYEAKFDFVIANGRAIQLAQAWSFETADPSDLAKEIKAWGWAVSDLRAHGGSVREDQSTLEVPSNVPIEVVYVPPNTRGAEEAFREANLVFGDLGALAHPESEVQSVARTAADLLHRHAFDSG